MARPAFVVFSLLLFAIPLEAAWILKKNTYVVDIDMSRQERLGQTVILKCDTTEEQINTNIHWEKKSNHHKPNSESWVKVGHGTELRVHVKDFPDAGNYTCRNQKREVLHYIVLLINEIVDVRGTNSKQILKEHPGTKKFINCEAKTYSGDFTCSWQIPKEGHEEMFVLQAEGGLRNVNCSHPALDPDRSVYTTNCQELGVCLHGEESQRVALVLHAIRGKRYENATTAFFIRNIVKPDPPQNLSISPSTERSIVLHWHYPESWNTQHTFFPLTFKVKVEETGKTQRKNTHNHQSGRRKRSKERAQYYDVEGTSLTLEQWNAGKTYCVQARDRYGASSWSDWSTCKHSM
ncbi:interleukin-12 subunit beta isoform X2 [Rhinatrema bivittatum]|nr:interleukin-12 subunit beta isoform X2 [Rhinatrema bivittatum]